MLSPLITIFIFFFFFQAEDGIRDKLVTGVQTCALPILRLTAKVDVVTTSTQHLVFNLTGGLDFFSQRNDVLSPADLQFEPQDGQPGTVVLGKATDLRLNLVGSVVHTYTPASNAFQATTSAGFQYENRDLNLTNVVGRT